MARVSIARRHSATIPAPVAARLGPVLDRYVGRCRQSRKHQPQEFDLCPRGRAATRPARLLHVRGLCHRRAFVSASSLGGEVGQDRSGGDTLRLRRPARSLPVRLLVNAIKSHHEVYLPCSRLRPSRFQDPAWSEKTRTLHSNRDRALPAFADPDWPARGEASRQANNRGGACDRTAAAGEKNT